MIDGFLGTIAIIALIVFLARLYGRVARLEAEVARLATAVPARAVDAETVADAALLEEPETPSVLAAEAEHESVPAGPWSAADRSATPGPELALPEESDAAAGPVPEERPDIETALGTRWAVWVGGVALALGAVFLIRYSIEQGVFGPEVRVAMAAAFGLVLAAAGEVLRRTGFSVQVPGVAGAYVPGILTAAGAFALFGAIYAAHGIYGFIGAPLAFVLLAIAGIGTIALALVHGQALAGLGLLGSLLTPLLVASEAPNPWTLFGYLAVVVVANTAIARLRDWMPTATLGMVGGGFWIWSYFLWAADFTAASPAFMSVVIVLALALIWLRRRPEGASAPLVDPVAIGSAVAVGVSAAAMMAVDDLVRSGAMPWGAALVAAMLGVAVWRQRALPLLFAAGLATFVCYARIVFSASFAFSVGDDAVFLEGRPIEIVPATATWIGVLLAGLFLAAAVFSAVRLLGDHPRRAGVWMAWGSLLPVAILAALWFSFGDVDRDWRYAAAALALCLVLVAVAEAVARRETPPLSGGWSVSFALAGAAAAAVLFAHAGFGTLATSILCGLLALVPAWATTRRPYPVLGWLSAAFAAVTLARVIPDPTIVGAAALGTTPVFNALLPAYALPAIAFAGAAWLLARAGSRVPRMIMEAAAVLFSLLTVAMLVRHAMNGGVIDSAEPRLAEQAIYTLIALGAGAILIALDMRAPSPVFRIGSIAAGVLSVAVIVVQHFVLLNPLLTNETTGAGAIFNILFLAYLLPGIAAGALAGYARGRRPGWYSAMLALLGAVLLFAWASLSLRRLFQGEYIGWINGMGQTETYAYSALWLALGVALLVVGLWQRSQVLRIASAAMIAIAVLKVFLFDMAELEGVLRALSFIGLGAVLIGIGLFYQRLLVRTRQSAG